LANVPINTVNEVITIIDPVTSNALKELYRKVV